MIILEKDGLQMEVCTDVQASVFERNGYKRVTAKPVPEKEPEPEQEPQPEVEETPKRRRRRVASKAE